MLYMKIKRFDNLWLMGLILCAVILVAVYVLKIFFPHFVIEVAQIESVTVVGHYIDTHKWAWYLASFVLSFFVYYFHCAACCKKKFLTIKESLIVIVTVLILFVIKEFLPNQYTSTNISSMILLPLIMKGDFKATTIVFIVINFVQTLTLEIRNLGLMIIDYNFATLLVLIIDTYIVQILLYLALNYKNKEA